MKQSNSIKYNALFYTHAPLTYKGVSISGDLTLWFEFRFTDSQGKKIFFNDESKVSDIPYIINFDHNTGYSIIKLSQNEGIKCECIPCNEAYLYNSESYEPIKLTLQEATKFLIDNSEYYNISDNYPAQTTSFK